MMLVGIPFVQFCLTLDPITMIPGSGGKQPPGQVGP